MTLLRRRSSRSAAGPDSLRRALTAAAGALGLVLAAPPAGAADRAEVVLGQVGLSFYAVVGGVVHEVLEARGIGVEIVKGSHAEIFPQLGAGEVDMLAAAWLPNGHAALHAPVREVTFEIAPLYEDARFFWAVPAYVPEAAVASVADLAKPEVRALMPGRIVSLPEATGLTQGGRRVMEAYGLDAAGYELVASPPAEWIGAFREAVAAERWVVFPLWQPHWANAAFALRRLAEPEGAYGAPDTAWLLGHEGLREKLPPEVLETLGRIRLSVEAVTEMDRLVNVEGMAPREAARTWMSANPATVAGWDGVE